MRQPPSARPIHVAQVLYSFLQGGSECLAANLATRFDPELATSSVYALTHDGPLRPQLQASGVACRFFARRPGIDWSLFGRLYRTFAHERVDVVLTHHLGQLVYAAPAGRLAGARIIHVEHDSHSARPPRARRQLRILAAVCHRVVAVGSGVRDFLVEQVGIPSSRVETIPNGVDTRLFRPEARRTKLDLGLPDDGLLVGHVGRLVPAKDHATLLEAFRRVLIAQPSSRLVLVGEGSLRSSLEARAREFGIQARVHWLGGRADVADILPHLDVFVLSSVLEGVPLAVLEAMAAARPVVSTRVGDVDRLIVDGRTGLLVAPGHPGALGEAVTALLGDPGFARRLGQDARVAIEHGFSLDQTVRAYERLLMSLPKVSAFQGSGRQNSSRPATREGSA